MKLDLRQFEQQSLAVAAHSKRVLALQILGNATLGAAFRATLPRLLAFAIWAGIFLAMLWLVNWADLYTAQFAGWMRHLLPGALRQHVSPRQLWTAGSWLLWICFWIVFPIILLPL